jgi:hypothetical protein
MLGRIKGDKLEWDPELSRGLPQPWDENVSPEIVTIEGPHLDSAWMELGPGCHTPPMAAGYPVEYELVRRDGRWRLAPMGERRRWRGETHYLARSAFVWGGKRYRLLVADNPVRWVDGKVEDEDLEDLSHCLGRARVVDPDGRDSTDLLLPKDLCVAAIASLDGRLAIAGLDRGRRLVFELREGTKLTRHSPSWKKGCHFAESRSWFHVDFHGPRDAEIFGSRRCPGDQVDKVALHFDGERFASARAKRPTDVPRDTIRLPRRDKKLDVEGIRVAEVFESEGVTWALAFCDYVGCLHSGVDRARLLYSSAKGPRRDGVKEGTLDLRFIETCLPHGKRIVVLAESKQPTAFADREIERIAKRQQVPDDCPIIEVRTPTQHFLGIPHEGLAMGEMCASYLAAPGRRHICTSLDSLMDETREPDTTGPARFRLRRSPP